MAVLTGGIGLPAARHASDRDRRHRSIWETVTKQAGVDVLLDPHEAIIDSTAWGYIMHPAERKPNQNDLIVGAEPFQRFNDMLTTCMKARVVMYQQPHPQANRNCKWEP